ncbi:2OG-Fe(II) oxygenase family protein [Pararhodobacter zhoushanensis]|uniref:Isopenicillin N synthase-like Fe(2+) 2OG dioxygenase domain-containing protein n=1 Tax=Pararhodobacter zhoushanensis TaxID=2479545 RepID=A0ABT3GZL9_9RHOB|nr:2OG-Fe(II) oxygenase family protein [Pararhodobacter zhoushanensis]MCW1933005.1 hypothetical protein [Pararhodobacter zhoushanensis]
MPGLAVQRRDGGGLGVVAEPGEFVLYFGEMLEMGSGGRIRATPHRVVGSAQARVSVPLFFNRSPAVNVAPLGTGGVVRAVDHLPRRFNETYVPLHKR